MRTVRSPMLPLDPGLTAHPPPRPLRDWLRVLLVLLRERRW